MLELPRPTYFGQPEEISKELRQDAGAAAFYVLWVRRRNI